MWRTLYVFDESRYFEALRIVAETPNVILYDSFWNADLLGYKIEIQCKSEQALKTLKIYISNTEKEWDGLWMEDETEKSSSQNPR